MGQGVSAGDVLAGSAVAQKARGGGKLRDCIRSGPRSLFGRWLQPELALLGSQAPGVWSLPLLVLCRSIRRRSTSATCTANTSAARPPPATHIYTVHRCTSRQTLPLYSWHYGTTKPGTTVPIHGTTVPETPQQATPRRPLTSPRTAQSAANLAHVSMAPGPSGPTWPGCSLNELQPKMSAGDGQEERVVRGV